MIKKVGIFIQARTSSKRFPKKVLAKIENKPMIFHVINRVKKIKNVEIFLLTTNNHEDDILEKIGEKNKISVFRGSKNDVLKRYYDCSLKNKIDIVIRITGDCPLIDPNIVLKMLNIFNENKFDYITNRLPPTFPDGLDVEIFSFDVLKKIHKKSKMKSEREHVTPLIIKNPKLFKIFNFQNSIDYSHLRWTVDDKKDLKLIRKIYKKLKHKKQFNMADILKIIKINPELTKINEDIQRDEGYKKSLKNDKIVV